MPTQRPRIFLTLGEKDLAALKALGERWGLPAPKVIRKALRQAAEKLPPQ
jgi:predicted DNA binding CopG/RHH family protein